MIEELNEETCIKCGAKLTRDDIGLHRKLVNLSLIHI